MATNARSRGRWWRARYAAPAKLAVTARNRKRLSAQPQRARTRGGCTAAAAVAESMSNGSAVVDEANALAGGRDLQQLLWASRQSDEGVFLTLLH